MDKRTLLAMFLVIVVFFVLQTYVFKPQPVPADQDQAGQTDTLAIDTLATPAGQFATPGTVLPDSLFKPAGQSEIVTLSNDNFTVQFSTLGASITSVELKNFQWGDLLTPVDLVPLGKNLAGIRLLDQQAGLDLRNVNWQHGPADSGRVVFWLGDQANPLVTKTFSLDEKYGILMDVSVQSPDPVFGIEYDFSAGIADSEKIKPRSKDADYKLLLFAENSLSKTTLAKIKKERPEGPLNAFKWAAMRTKYFTIAMSETRNPLIRNYYADAAKDTGNPSLILDSRDRNPSQYWEQSFLIYAGPADYDIMKSYEKSRLEYVPERGPSWLRWLSNAIAWLLKFLHSFIPNYGIVIIIFSILLKIILHPLTHKSMDASLKMQRIQPQVQEIQKQYKSDPKTMQMELSKLYKEAGASPMSGCLPLLLQMPIFIALYNVLRYTIDMRNASFLGWLKDLSEPDPYWILPILMAIFMILQSLMMRPKKEALAQMDEKQQAMQQSTRMMTWLMPIMMFFIFKGLPSGLVLYYTVFNILSVAQQYYLQKRSKLQTEATPAKIS
ncbi:MAG: membrane protein insertase YidC [Candidatus Syntrophosphaera sp.]|nr:membrane protein insertase YidC [Candidatus Syntrophosphaera sp.]